MTETMTPLAKEQVIPCIEAVREILQKFQMDVESNRIKRENIE
jgi:hypothetical protein